MNVRWIVAAVAAVGLGLAALPFLPSSSESPAPAAPAAESPGPVADAAANACSADARKADMSFVLPELEGGEVNFADLEGKVVLLNFWATWCGPCKVEIPGFVELQEKYRDDGVVFLGLSVDDTVEKLRPFAAEYQINYPVLIGDGHDDVQEAFGPIWGIPVTVVIGRDGQICRTHMGLATKEQVERDIRALL